MKKKANRLDAIKMIISSKEVGSQEELLQELGQEGFELTQATLSRDLKQLKVAKAASMNGKYVYVLPNDIMYKRVGDQSASEMLMNNGFISLQFSGNIAVIKTRPDCRRRYHHAGVARRSDSHCRTKFLVSHYSEYQLTNNNYTLH